MPRMAAETNFRPLALPLPSFHREAAKVESLKRDKDIEKQALDADSYDLDTSEDEEDCVRARRKFWNRVRRSRIRRSRRFADDDLYVYKDHHGRLRVCRRPRRRIWVIRLFCLFFAFILGSSVTLTLDAPYHHNTHEHTFHPYHDPQHTPISDQQTLISPQSPPSSFLQSVVPIQCSSHQDQRRHNPLYSALSIGCTSIELDIHSPPSHSSLLLGHDEDAPAANRTLQDTYLTPLLSLLSARNPAIPESTTKGPKGLFPLDPSQTLILILNFKPSDADADAARTWTLLQQTLSPLRAADYLTSWSRVSGRVIRPITIVASGGAAWDLIVADPDYRDVFFDMPLEALVGEGDLDEGDEDEGGRDEGEDEGKMDAFKFNTSNSYLASAPTSSSFWVGVERLFDVLGLRRETRQRRQMRQAERRGLVPRSWPRASWWEFGGRNFEDVVRRSRGLVNVDVDRTTNKNSLWSWKRRILG
ncbi:hypothetical protein K402DRAFT_402002 [Aulographum hederae CBS 113979]|uniref:PLC-like phosphodiesterase n=1 Tax=Aulographum hederae CBS 113979 TaxID=1176131 RepID=A0A6G1H8K9_9PEZI|nr:hypothetical protein K402DRAFT_402002 [Aulographum hederae CBS 113979]